ncbi:tetratricopeptide repeat protein [Succinimonas amylolytica]|uniref:tetratricopeptide repeat protein n=1 Tax=Succinimonas amylolytica TaxID=83769 RepID=UPI000373215D|nr:tetratricopeptide repeat protein [Succinimonas amylolytica]
MSVINKALSELDKRERGAQYGKYVPPKEKSSFFPALAGAGIMAVVALTGVAGYFYYTFGKQQVPATGSTEAGQTAIGLSDGTSVSVSPGSNISKGGADQTAQSSETVNEDRGAPAQSSDSVELMLLAEGAVNQETGGVVPVSAPGAQPAREVSGKPLDSSLAKDVRYPGNASEKRISAHSGAVRTSKVIPDVSDGVQIADIASPEIIIDDNAPENFVIVEEPRVQARNSPSMRVKQKKLTPKEEADLLRKEAENSLLRGDNTGAIKSYEVLLKKNPGDSRTREKLASLYYGKGRSLDAIKTLDRGIILDPAHYDYRLYLARIYSAQGQDSQAIKVLRQGNPPARGNMDYYATLAGLARKNNDYPEAIRAYQKLASAEKQDGKWYLGLAISLEETGKVREALDAYRKASALYLSAQSRSFAEQRIGVLGGKK